MKPYALATYIMYHVCMDGMGWDGMGWDGGIVGTYNMPYPFCSLGLEMYELRELFYEHSFL